jgi:hypothetical protein
MPRAGTVAILLRAAAAVLFALVPLGILGRGPFAPARPVLVLDDSPSVQRRLPGFPEEARRLWQRFDGGRHPVFAAGARPHPDGRAEERVPYTDLAPALRAAAASVPPGVEGRLLLATDGQFRDEGIAGLARELRARRTRVFALTPPPATRVARVTGILLPERVFLWEPFTVRGQVAASAPGDLRVRLLRNGEPVEERTVALDATGRAEVSFAQELDRVGRVAYGLALAEKGSPTVVGEVAVARAPRVVWLSDDVGAAGPVIALLQDAGVPVELTQPGDLLAPAQDLARADVIVLDDLPAVTLTDAILEGVRRAVAERGAGLLVLGGRKGLGTEEFAGSPLEALLPVKAGFAAPPPPASVSLVVALDTSFSMFYRGRGEKVFYSSEPRKIDVAKESTKAVARIIRPGDRLGILGNSTDLFWIHPLGEVRDQEALLRRIDAVFADGDGLNFYSVVNEAYQALRREPGGLRHLLILCDSEDIDQYEIAGVGHAHDLVRAMAREGITVSVLAIGRPTDKDVPFLRTATLLGRGDFYLVPRIVALPRYFTAEYQRLAAGRHFVEEDVVPVAGEPSPLLEGVIGALPPLSGVALVTAREGSHTLLQTGAGSPLLTTGTYGKGRTAVFMGDNGYRWASRWIGGEARRFWLQTLFGVAPGEEEARGFAASFEADRRGDRLLFHYTAPEKAGDERQELWLRPAASPEAEPVRLARVGLRSYRFPGALPPEGFLRARVTADREGLRDLVTTGRTVPPAEEDLPDPERWESVELLLRETGGGWVRSPAEMGGGGRLSRAGASRLAFTLLACGILLLLAESVVRLSRED